MLLIDDKQVSTDEFINRVEQISGKKIPLDQIKNNMEFKYNQVRNSFDLAHFVKSGIKLPKEKRSDDILASFNVFSEKDNRTVSFRFANRRPYSNPDKPNIIVYTPKAIDISGGTSNYEPREIEQVIYMYCHPSCFDSPLYVSGTTYKYSHNNLKVASQRKKDAMSRAHMAFQHASNVDDSELKVLAKGLSTVKVQDANRIVIPPNADVDDYRVALQEFAMKNPEVYLEKTGTETLKYEGMIMDAIDSGYIVRKKVGDFISWSFAKGRKAGEQITIVQDGKGDALQEFKNHMKNNAMNYIHDLSILNQDITADMTAESQLKAYKEGLPSEATTPHSEELLLTSVVDHKSSTEFLRLSHPQKGNPSPTNAKAFLEKVLSGDINDGNVSEEVKNYIKQS